VHKGDVSELKKTPKDECPVQVPWVPFFLCCLKKQKDNLTTKLARELVLAQSLAPLSLEVLSLLREQERLGISDQGAD
jgi:hypothetical protein